MQPGSVLAVDGEEAIIAHEADDFVFQLLIAKPLKPFGGDVRIDPQDVGFAEMPVVRGGARLRRFVEIGHFAVGSVHPGRIEIESFVSERFGVAAVVLVGFAQVNRKRNRRARTVGGGYALGRRLHVCVADGKILEGREITRVG